MKQPSLRLAGGTALVTGASSGIGQAIADEIAQRGTGLIIVGRDTVRLNEVANEIRHRHGVDVVELVAKLDSEDGLAAVEQALRSATDLRLLVNCAGMGTVGSFAKSEGGSIAAVVTVQTEAIVRACHAALPALQVAAANGHRAGILNVSSIVDSIGIPFNVGYSAAKSFVTVFSRGLRSELRTTKVVVTVLRPGNTRSRFHERVGLGDSPAAHKLTSRPEDVARAGLNAFDSDVAVCTPGAMAKAISVTMRLTPSGLTRAFMTRIGPRMGIDR